MSRAMQRCSELSKLMSPLSDSQLPSKAQPMRRPSPSMTGEPELPPVMSFVVRKQTGMVPSAMA